MSKQGNIWLLVVIAVFYLCNGITYLQRQSVNADEGSFTSYAIRYLKGRPDRIDPKVDNSKMPVIVLNVMPRAVQQVLDPGLTKQDFGLADVMMGRYVSLFISLFILFLVYHWGFLLYGPHAGLFAAFLYSFCPNGMANNVFVSTDMYSVLMLLACMFLFWKWSKGGGMKYFLWLSLAVAVSQLVKQSLFHLYVLLPLMLLVGRYLGKIPALTWRMAVVFMVVQVLVINTGYYFHRSFMPLGDHHFMSGLFQGLQDILPSWTPMPFPLPFIEGLDMAKYCDQVGGGIYGQSSFGKVTILGRESTGGAFWYYYLVTLFFKTPVAFMSMFGVAIWKLRNRWSWEEFILMAPVLYFLVVMSFFYKTQVGIRHVIFIFPLVFLLISSLLRNLPGRGMRWFLALASVYLVLSVGYYWGNYFPYTNEFIANKKNAWRYVGSSNLELEQGQKFAVAYIRSHPTISFAPQQPSQGIYLVKTSEYLNIWNKKEWEWLRHGEVVGEVGFNWLLVKY